MTSEKWKQIRLMGKVNYAIRYGVLRWGILFSCLSAISLFLTSSEEANALNIALNSLMWLCGGYFLGNIFWMRNESRYR